MQQWKSGCNYYGKAAADNLRNGDIRQKRGEENAGKGEKSVQQTSLRRAFSG